MRFAFAVYADENPAGLSVVHTSNNVVRCFLGNDVVGVYQRGSPPAAFRPGVQTPDHTNHLTYKKR